MRRSKVVDDRIEGNQYAPDAAFRELEVADADVGAAPVEDRLSLLMAGG
jgi:hypothetical protein